MSVRLKSTIALPRRRARSRVVIPPASQLTTTPSFNWPGARPPHKYAAKAVVVDGIRFASTAEATRYGQLAMLVKAGQVTDLELQPKFPLHAQGGARVGCYVADFRYRHTTEGVVVEDVKGVDVPLGRWKRRHCEAEYGIAVRVIRRRREDA